MKKHVYLMAFLMTVLIPGMIFSFFSKYPKTAITEETPVPSSQNNEISVSVLMGNEIVQMDLETYITGVLLGEIPADFELEAMKAQAVATRTYTLRRIAKGTKHSGAAVCTDPGCCQAFCAVEDYSGSKENRIRFQQAVVETASEVLTYQGELIEATYFSSSGGKTETAAAVWNQDIPYLRAVDSPGEQAGKYSSYESVFTPEEFLMRLGLPLDHVRNITCDHITYTDGNGVKSISVCAVTYSGQQFREALGLPSTMFEVAVGDSKITVTTKGHGHRVGMSQYGAEAMAVAGESYKEILAHYYPGTTLCKWTKEIQ